MKGYDVDDTNVGVDGDQTTVTIGIENDNKETITISTPSVEGDDVGDGNRVTDRLTCRRIQARTEG